MEQITRDHLRQLRLEIVSDIKKILSMKGTDKQEFDIDWLRSKAIRRIMNISPATLQNLRITGKIRFRKVMGSYYYSRTDLLKLFEDGK
ncbi:Helix-turn-helix domain-containing protein [Chryseobacterium oleae]|uniref:Helix-turn-helix domain-containing protein n=1 Tax=Chryseobacterium oleae TaxID=491207 RepID=A0A1I4YZL1_CHROL|nr:helix-turn-helix domain-containing protein [Chryseobacterium oleae]SFN43465.1 Helix-turn-helix domain-containing protein [Chryseobacterium oleae]